MALIGTFSCLLTFQNDLLKSLAQPASATVFGMPLKLIFQLQASIMELTIPLLVHKCIEFLIPKYGMLD